MYSLNAVHIHPSCKNFKPTITQEGLVNETPFFDKLNVRVGAKIIIIYNIDTSDGLTNGTTGIVVGFIKSNGEPAEIPGDVHKVLIKCDNFKDGEQMRFKN